MNTFDQSITAPVAALGTPRPRSASRRVRAILAGGLVLGLGAAVTLAAWTDQEFASGTFTAGDFVFQGASASGVYGDHTTSGGAASLAFTLPTATHLTPSDSVSAPFSIKLTGDSSATVALTNATVDAAQGLSYAVTKTATWGCGAGTSVISSTALGAGAGSASLGTMAPGDEWFYCFTVTANAAQTGSSALVKGATSTGIWQFAATSTP